MKTIHNSISWTKDKSYGQNYLIFSQYYSTPLHSPSFPPPSKQAISCLFSGQEGQDMMQDKFKQIQRLIYGINLLIHHVSLYAHNFLKDVFVEQCPGSSFQEGNLHTHKHTHTHTHIYIYTQNFTNKIYYNYFKIQRFF